APGRAAALVGFAGRRPRGSTGRGPADFGAQPAPRRLGDRRPLDRPAARVPPDRSDLRRRAAAVPGPVEPARAIRPRRARPAALDRPEARRVGRVHLADRRPAASAGTDESPLDEVQLGPAPGRLVEAALGIPALRAARARAT